MSLQFRHFKQILDDWLSFVIGHSSVTDINPGSVVRTIGEASAIEIAQLYVQLQSILNLFSIDKASGEDLDERALDYDMTREPPTRSAGVVTIGDSNLTVSDIAVSTLAAGLTAGASTQAQIQAGALDWDLFPSSGILILDRGTPALRESIAWVSKTAPDLLNFDTGVFPIYSHDAAGTVYKSTVGSDRSIPLSTIVMTPAPEELKFETTAAETLYDGDHIVANVPIQSRETGAAQNATAGAISLFESTPFPTATVTNGATLQGGTDLETDADFRARIKESWQALSSSTVLRILAEALKVQIPSTGQRVITAKVIEPIAPGASTLYINDGTASYSPSTVGVEASEFLIGVAEAGQLRAGLDYWPIVSDSEILLVSLERGTTTATGTNSLTDSTKSWGTNDWQNFKVKDSNNQIYSIASNDGTELTLSGGATPAPGAYAIFDPTIATTFPTGSRLTKNVDYIINDTNGQVELTTTSFPTGLEANDCLLVYYNGATDSYVYYDGLLREVQRVINGDPNDLETYPGVKAAGSVVEVTAPSIVTVTVAASMSAVEGYDEADLRDLAKSAIVDYINSLSIGEDVIRSKIIEVAMSITGVLDFAVTTPATNTVITDSQLAKTTLANITVT
jgi:uncharacterized phage protein gp47/JayE